MKNPIFASFMNSIIREITFTIRELNRFAF
jgi:hypothetical protein